MKRLELIDLNGVCRTSLPEYPVGLCGASGLLIDDKIVICGGEIGWNWQLTKNCYQLRNGNDAFQYVHSMNVERDYAKSAIFQGNMLVTGGCYPNSCAPIGSGEFIVPQQKPDIQLPEPLSSHSFIKINQTTVLLVGGNTNSNGCSKKTFYMNIDINQWKHGPDLKTSRCWHTAGVLIDHINNNPIVAVVGGDNGTPLNSVELLVQGQNYWTDGISIAKFSNQT